MRLSPCRVRLVCVLTALALAATGCTSMRGVPLVRGVAPAPDAGLEAGDEVRITLFSGRRVTVVLAEITEVAIVTRDGTVYPRDQVARVERRQFSGTKTAVLAIGLGATVLLVAWAVATASLAGNLGSCC